MILPAASPNARAAAGLTAKARKPCADEAAAGSLHAEASPTKHSGASVCLYRYPSPSGWSGPPSFARPSNFPSARRSADPRSFARNPLVSRRHRVKTAIGLRQIDIREGGSRCGHQSSQSQSRRHSALRPAATPILNAASPARPLVPSARKSRAETRSPARLSGARQASSVTTSRRSFAANQTHAGRLTGSDNTHVERAARPDGRVALFCVQKGRGDRCSRKS